MKSSIIRVSNLGKRYSLGGPSDYATLRDSFASLFSRRGRIRAPRDEFWALKDVTFSLERGEVLGIVGRNGAGKSTLLKLLSRITAPDTGRIELEGRVGSLLEVGTGFHPELTGRENIFMNGVLLGMRRSEVARKFDEIVEFSGVEKFLDTPVKRYSSGMRVRLGFAVAAHLDPEILVIDEVLAVGDAEFQRKCLGRMNAVATEGRTILFVSHQMEAVQSLCTRALWLEGGSIQADGSASEVVLSYLASTSKLAISDIATRKDRSGRGNVRICNLSLADESGHSPSTGKQATIRFNLRADAPQKGAIIARFVIRDSMDRILTLLTSESDPQGLAIDGDEGEAICYIPKVPLVPGDYTADVSFWLNGYLEDKVNRALAFTVLAGDYFNSGKGYQVGSFHVDQEWSSH